MQQKPKHYFYIGLFVLLGFAIFACACVVFGGGKLFAKKMYFETYFNSSVEGLDVGGAVKFRGLKLGKIESITFTGAHYAEDETVSAAMNENMTMQYSYVRVVCSIDLKRHTDISEEHLERLVQCGLRAKMQSAGITGGAFLTLDYDRSHLYSKSTALQFSWTPEYLYVPSVPSTLQNVMTVVEDLTDQLREVDIPKMVNAVNSLVESINSTVQNAKVPQLTESITTLANGLNAQVATIQKIFDELDTELIAGEIKNVSHNLSQISTDLRDALPKVTDSATTTFAQMNATLNDASALLKETNETLTAFRAALDPDTMSADIEASLNAVSRTTASLEALVNELREKPSRILFDEPLEE